MKKNYMKMAGIVFLAIFTRVLPVSAQVQYTYPLSENFHGMPATAPDLIAIPNNMGFAGAFVQRSVPATTCGTTGIAHGYFFEDDAGLQFNNPAGFIGQSYSIAFNFQIDQFITPPQWVRLLSFTHTDDVGVYIRLTDPPNHGTLEFWPFGMVGTDDFFTTVDFYQMILVRNAAGLIKVYVNGQEFAEYDDSGSQAYVPQAPGNFIIWFRDDPSVLANEASPGFVADIVIGDTPWTPAEVQQKWLFFCSQLLDVAEIPVAGTRVYPNPASRLLTVELPAPVTSGELAVIGVTGEKMITRAFSGKAGRVDISKLAPGLYFLELKTAGEKEYFRFIKE
jgi:hypothetical protein